MQPILLVMNSYKKFEYQLMKATDVVEPQSCMKSRNCRLLAICTIFKQFARAAARVQNLKYNFFTILSYIFYIANMRPHNLVFLKH